MKLTLKTLAVALAAITLSPAALADTAKDGTVHITGLIQQNACTVKTDSVLIEVTLQNEFASLLLPQGKRQGIKASPSISKTATQTSTAMYRRALKVRSTEPMRPS